MQREEYRKARCSCLFPDCCCPVMRLSLFLEDHSEAEVLGLFKSLILSRKLMDELPANFLAQFLILPDELIDEVW